MSCPVGKSCKRSGFNMYTKEIGFEVPDNSNADYISIGDPTTPSYFLINIDQTSNQECFNVCDTRTDCAAFSYYERSSSVGCVYK